MSRIVFFFDPTGTGRCFYTEAIPLQTLGRLHIRRATAVEFNPRSQQWEVADAQGSILFQSPSRQACLDWEQDQFNR